MGDFKTELVQVSAAAAEALRKAKVTAMQFNRGTDDLLDGKQQEVTLNGVTLVVNKVGEKDQIVLKPA